MNHTLNDNFCPQITIIIPALNEAEGIGSVLKDIEDAHLDFVHEVIVVNDGSTDCTEEIAQGFNVKIVTHRRTMGYGASLKSGIRQANMDYVLFMDADGQHRAKDVLRLWNHCVDNDMVVGQRTSLIHSPMWRMPGKWLLWSLATHLTDQKIPDLNSGFRLLKKETVLKYMHLCPSGFSFSTTITMALLTRGYAVEYVPIEIHKRVGKSTVTIKTGFNTLTLILRIATLFNPLKVFIPSSIIIGLVGVIYAIPYALLGRGISVGAMLAIVTAILLFGLGLLCDQISQLRLERYE